MRHDERLPGRAPASDRARLQHGRAPRGHAGGRVPRRNGATRTCCSTSGRASFASCRPSSIPHDLTAIVIGHMHADHFLDLVGLRYLYPWGEPAPNPLPVHLPPGGRERLDALADAVSRSVSASSMRPSTPSNTTRQPSCTVGDLRPALLPEPPLRPGLGRGRRGARRRAPGLHRRHGTVGRRRGCRRATRTCCSSRPRSDSDRHDDPSAAT